MIHDACGVRGQVWELPVFTMLTWGLTQGAKVDSKAFTSQSIMPASEDYFFFFFNLGSF